MSSTWQVLGSESATSTVTFEHVGAALSAVLAKGAKAPVGSDPMRYPEFERRIVQIALAAPAKACHHFAIDTIRQLADSSEDAVKTELSSAERELLNRLLSDLSNGALSELTDAFSSLIDSTGKDPVRAIELRSDLTQLLCAIDSYIRYRQIGDPHLIAAIAINGINGVDYAIGGDGENYSTDNILGSPRMVAEYERVQRLLAPD